MFKDLIFLKGTATFSEEKSTATIRPGALVEIKNNGLALQATAKADVSALFVRENYLVGKTVLEAYVANDNVPIIACAKGAELNALLAPSAPAIVKGNYLESAGAGNLRKHTDGKILAIAMESVNNSGNNAIVFITIKIV